MQKEILNIDDLIDENNELRNQMNILTETLFRTQLKQKFSDNISQSDKTHFHLEDLRNELTLAKKHSSDQANKIASL